jgi:protein SCO1/2
MKLRSRSLAGLLAAACCASAALLGAADGLAHDVKKHAPESSGGSGYERSVRSYTIPDVVLRDADARPVRLRELLATDDPVMLNFIFTTCSTICPVMVRVFADVPPRLGVAARDLRMISISIDPENDTPAKLKSYSKDFGEGLRWRFLTGRVEDIKSVQLAFDTYRGDKMAHEPLTLMRQSRGKAWVRIDGFASPDELASEYRRMALK